MLLDRYQQELLEAGCDEAGRGCLAGPVFAAAVILPEGFDHPWLNDSKRLTPRRREIVREVIEQQAIAWSVTQVTSRRIDRINILRASFEAMSLAAGALDPQPQFLIVDGNRFRSRLDIPFACIVGGDAAYKSIAAASILAKTHRDAYMGQLAKRFPAYGWERNKGYPTREHRKAIALHGVTKHHRMSFSLLPDPELALFS